MTESEIIAVMHQIGKVFGDDIAQDTLLHLLRWEQRKQTPPDSLTALAFIVAQRRKWRYAEREAAAKAAGFHEMLTIDGTLPDIPGMCDPEAQAIARERLARLPEALLAFAEGNPWVSRQRLEQLRKEAANDYEKGKKRRRSRLSKGKPLVGGILCERQRGPEIGRMDAS